MRHSKDSLNDSFAPMATKRHPPDAILCSVDAEGHFALCSLRMEFSADLGNTSALIHMAWSSSVIPAILVLHGACVVSTLDPALVTQSLHF